MTGERCPACVAPEGTTCRAIAIRAPQICRYVAEGRPKWIARVKGAAEPGPTGPSSRPWLDRHLLILGCDYRGPKNGEGCGCTHACFLGKGQVAYRQCDECVRTDR